MSDHASPEPQSTHGKYVHSFLCNVVCAAVCVCVFVCYSAMMIMKRKIVLSHYLLTVTRFLFRKGLINSLMESKHWHTHYLNHGNFHLKCESFTLLSLLSVGARVQPDRRVLQEALPDRYLAAGTGAGPPGRAGPQTSSFGHLEDSHGQTLSGCTLRHQGSQNTERFFPCDSHRQIHTDVWLLVAAASGRDHVLLSAGKLPVSNLPTV